MLIALSVIFVIKTESGIPIVAMVLLMGISMKIVVEDRKRYSYSRPWDVLIGLSVQFVIKPENGIPRSWECSYTSSSRRVRVRIELLNHCN